MEQFEVDDTNVASTTKLSVFKRLANASQRTIYSINQNIVNPVRRAVDPFRQGLELADRAYELVILKIGNPLVVKRLLYVSFVVVLVNSLYYAERNESVKGVSGGGFTDGKLFDIEMLGNSLKQYIDPLVLKENIEYVSSISRFPGTVGDLALARYIHSYFGNNGMKTAYIDEHKTYINYPGSDGTYLKFSDGSFSAELLYGSGDDFQRLAFNPGALAADEMIEAPYIFANFGEYSDFQRLAESGISLEGCIVLVKYGGKDDEFMKVTFAHEQGAKALVFITPPFTSSDKVNDEYIAKVGVAKTRVCPGDILNPLRNEDGNDGHEHEQDQDQDHQQKWHDSPLTPDIPTIPVSWKDGQYLIEQLKNNGIQFEDGTYSGTADKSKKLQFSCKIKESVNQPIWNVVATIKGREQGGKAIVFGAARDSTCNGASTSASNTAALLELVKMFTSLQRQYDWSPSRTIYFISFDATDYNLAGSAIWVNKSKRYLLEQLYTYIEVSDLYMGDLLSIFANPLVQGVVLDEMKNVVLDPAHFNGVLSLFELYTQQHGGQAIISSSFLDEKNYVPFINSLNVPAIDIGFRSAERTFEPFQSCLDLFEYLNEHLDGKMHHQVAVIELLARLGLRLAEDPMIPFNLNQFANHIIAYKEDLQKQINDRPELHSLSLTDLNRGISKLLTGAQSIEEFKQEWREFMKNSATMEPVMLGNTRRFTNENVVAFNRLFLDLRGHESRPGYYNFLTGTTYYAPKYGPSEHFWNSFPFVRDAIMTTDHERTAVLELERLGRALEQGGAILLAYG